MKEVIKNSAQTKVPMKSTQDKNEREFYNKILSKLEAKEYIEDSSKFITNLLNTLSRYSTGELNIIISDDILTLPKIDKEEIILSGSKRVRHVQESLIILNQTYLTDKFNAIDFNGKYVKNINSLRIKIYNRIKFEIKCIIVIIDALSLYQPTRINENDKVLNEFCTFCNLVIENDINKFDNISENSINELLVLLNEAKEFLDNDEMLKVCYPYWKDIKSII